MQKTELFKNKKAVIFDRDGTLVDSLGMWGDIDNRFFALHNRKMPADYVECISHLSFMERAVYTKNRFHLTETPEEIASLWLDWSRQAYEKEILAKPNVKEFLKQLKDKGYILSLATTNKRELYRPCLIRNQRQCYFDFARDVNDINSKKSEPKIYLRLAEKRHAKVEETLVFEDILPAIETAKKAGFTVVGVYDKHNHTYENEIRNACDYYRHSYTELRN